MKKHLIVVLCLVVLYFIAERIVGGFDPQATPFWLVPTVLFWTISLAGSVDSDKPFPNLICIALYISMLAILGAGMVGAWQSSKADLGFSSIGCFMLTMIAFSAVVITRTFYKDEIFGKSKLASYAISLGQLFAIIAVLTLF